MVPHSFAHPPPFKILSDSTAQGSHANRLAVPKYRSLTPWITYLPQSSGRVLAARMSNARHIFCLSDITFSFCNPSVPHGHVATQASPPSFFVPTAVSMQKRSLGVFPQLTTVLCCWEKKSVFHWVSIVGSSLSATAAIFTRIMHTCLLPCKDLGIPA